MGSRGYAKCHWCKTEGWNFHIPDGVDEPLCGKCLCGDDSSDQEENPTTRTPVLFERMAGMVTGTEIDTSMGEIHDAFHAARVASTVSDYVVHVTPLARVTNREDNSHSEELTPNLAPADTDVNMKANEHSGAAEDRMQHRWTESTWYTRQPNDRTGSTGRNLTPPTRSEPYPTDHVGNRRAAADVNMKANPSDLSTGANTHTAAADNRMPHQWTQSTLNTRQSNDRTGSTGRNLIPSTRSGPYPTDLAPDAKHQTWPQMDNMAIDTVPPESARRI